jgi:hypothetical protein
LKLSTLNASHQKNQLKCRDKMHKDIKIREMFGLGELEFYLTIYYLELIVAEQIFNIRDVRHYTFKV